MNLQYWWWILAAILVVAELLTGTLYLLAIALGAAAAGLAALFGLSGWLQLLICALVTALGAYWVHRKRIAEPPEPPESQNPNLQTDIGHYVYVQSWESGGRARVQYRGTEWDAVATGGTPTQPGWFRVTAVEQNRLHLIADAQNEPT